MKKLSPANPKRRLQIWLQMAIFAAMAVALGLVLIAVPNVELVSATFFVSGYFLGLRRGVATALVGEFLYSLLNPFGAAPPPLLFAQLLGMGLFAAAGATLGRRFGSLTPVLKMTVFGLLGLGLTFCFDFLTTLSFLIFSGLTKATFLASLIYGLGFYVLHILSNTAIFLFLIPFILQFLEKHTFAFSAQKTPVSKPKNETVP
jgi:hypothetical protein